MSLPPLFKTDGNNDGNGSNDANKRNGGGALMKVKWKSPMHGGDEEDDDGNNDKQTSSLLAIDKTEVDRDEEYIEQMKAREMEGQEKVRSMENEALDPTWKGGIEFIDDIEIL